MRPTGWELAPDSLAAPAGERRGTRVLRRLAVREHGVAFWVALWAAAAALELIALIPVFDGDVTGADAVFIAGMGAFMACGLAAWRRRPDNHSGRLMTATGVAGLIYPILSQLDAPLTTTVAALFVSAWVIGYVALLLSFPTAGRLERTIDRLVVGAFVLTMIVLQFTWLLFLDVDGNLLLVHPDAELARAIDDAREWLTGAASLAASAVIAARWHAASRPQRKALLPSVVGGVSGVLFSVQLVEGLVAPPESQLLFWVTNCVLLLVPAAYLFGLLRSRLARSGLADLFLELRTMHGEQLRAALARALGDPSLEIVHGAASPARADGRSVAPIERDGEQIAALVYDASLDDDPELVETVSAAASIALEYERLHEESQARLAELRASRERLVAAGDEERRRLERNLHDGAQQRLVAVAGARRRLLRRSRAAAEGRSSSPPTSSLPRRSPMSPSTPRPRPSTCA
jgi:hypothetical protein